MRQDFAVFILTHGRPGNIKTLKALENGNYTGRYYIMIDNEDKTADEYYKLYGDKVIMFDKVDVASRFDEFDNFSDRRSVVYARNASFEFAKKMGIKYHLQLDDDYTTFAFRVIRDNQLKSLQMKNLDKMFNSMIEFLNSSGAISVAMAQAGDFIGGKDNPRYHKGLIRKAMNTFFCDIDKYFQFIGRINEDVNTYTYLGSKGVLFLTVTKATINQMATQGNLGGMTDIYLDKGTYVKSFYTVMVMPSAVKIGEIGTKHRRVHHKIDWNKCVPKILDESLRK